MYRILATLFMIFIYGLTAGQNVTWGPEIKRKGKTIYEKALLLPEGDLLLVQRKKNAWKQRWEPYLIKLSQDRLTIRRDETIPLEYEKNDLKYENLYRIGEKLFLFSSYHNVSQKKNYLFASELSTRSFKMRPLMRISDVPSDKNEATPYYIEFSPDSTKIGIVALYNSDKKGAILKLTLMDNAFNYLYEKEHQLRSNSGKMSFDQLALSNDGTFFILGKEKLGTSVFNQSEIYDHFVYRYNNLGHRDTVYRPGIEELNLTIEQKERFFISEMRMDLRDEHLLLGGLFSESGSNSSKGTLYYRYNLSSNELELAFFDYFDYEALTAQLSDRGLRKARDAYDEIGVKGLPEIRNLKIVDFIKRSDGGLVFLTEQQENYVEYDRGGAFFFDPVWGYRYDPFMSANDRVYYHHVFNDVFVVNVGSEGWIEWTARVPKFQHTINDRGYYSSFTHFTIRDRLGIIFNEHPGNIGTDEQRYTYEGNNGVGKISAVYLDGELESSEIRPMPGSIQIVPSASRQIDINKILLVGLGRKTIQVGILSI